MNSYFENAVMKTPSKDSLFRKIISFIPRTWITEEKKPWLIVNPQKKLSLSQGWKIHISTTIYNAEKIAEIVIPILIRNNYHFKIVSSIPLLSIINELHYPMSAANKYITIYPNSIDDFRECILELNKALSSFSGPRIHTDYQCGKNGVVHFRYGGFAIIKKFDHLQNKMIPCIKNEKGELIEDKRNPWYEKPSWVEEPFNDLGIFKNSNEPSQEELMTLNKYEFLSILSRANKGNVYSAKRRSDNLELIIKESNPYVGSNTPNSNPHRTIQNEINILKKMSYTHNVPMVFEDFSCGNKHYLVEEKIIGSTLIQYTNSLDLNCDQRVHIIHSLMKIVDEFHRNKFVLKDLKPTNIMVSSLGELFLIDLETVEKNDTKNTFKLNTQGYFNPEFKESNSNILNDWYAVIISLLSLYSRSSPVFNKDSSLDKTYSRDLMVKVVGYIETLYIHKKLSQKEYELFKSIVSQKLLLNYMELKKYHEIFHKNLDSIGIITESIDGMLSEFNDSLKDNSTRLWRSTFFGESTNKMNIQNGISGVGAFLLCYINSHNKTQNAIDALENISKYITNNMGDYFEDVSSSENSYSFLFGSKGFAWFLSDFGKYHNNEDLIEYSELVSSLDTDDENIDVALGSAGKAYVEMKLWMDTSKFDHYQKMKHHIQHILKTSKKTDLGFAHGDAGIAYIVYLAAKLEKNKKWLDFALSKINSLVTSCENMLLNDPKSIDISWCKGIAGIGTALVRINQFENNPRISSLLTGFKDILLIKMWSESPCLCHGNSSSIEFLMDAYQLTSDTSFYNAAKIISNYICSQLYYNKNDHLNFPSETFFDSVYDLGVGTTGPLQSLLRVHHKSLDRLFMLNEVKLLNTPISDNYNA